MKNKTFTWNKAWTRFIAVFLLAFLIPVVVMLLVLKTGGFYPFGDKTLFLMDMKGQYLEFFASLRNSLQGDDSIFFSWSRSMGGNYLGLFAYYVASPLSFLTVFFPIHKLTDAIVILTLLKLGLCGCSFAGFAFYLKKSREVPVSDLVIVPFAVCYALISYNMVYSLCLMWIDGVILLPMVLLGVEKILDGKKGLHYLLSLAALFICNYYTGYMVGVFTAVYFVFRIVSRLNRDAIKEAMIHTVRFTVTTLLAFGLSAPLILPVVKDLMQGKLATLTYQPDTKTNFVFSALFGKLKNGIYDSITNAGLPAIYCGYLALVLALVYFVVRKITIREKAGAALILGFLSLSFYFTKWDIAWHGFQYPTWFPYRYAFVFSFFLLYMAFRTVLALPWEKLCSGALSIMKTDKAQIVFLATLTLVVAIEMGMNGKALLAGLDGEFHYGTVEEYESFLNKTQPLVSQIQEEDDGFYRINQGYEYSKNDDMLLGYHGMTHYSSTFNAAVNTLTQKLGIAQAHIWNSGYGSNAMLDSLFSVKYLLDDGLVPSSYTQIGSSEGGASAYLNPNVLSIAYSTPIESLTPNVDTGDIFVNQNNYLNTLYSDGQEQSYFTEYPYNSSQDGGTWNYSFTADSENPVYLYMQAGASSWADVFVNGNWVGNYFSTETTCSLYLGQFTNGQPVNVQVVLSDASVNIGYAAIGELHMDLLQASLDCLRQTGMKVEQHKGGTLSGTVSVAEGETIVTSIPYDAGWTVKIDGKKAEVEKYADTFLAVPASAGLHQITFSYVSPGFGTGMLLFVVAVLLSGFYFYGWAWLVNQKKKRKVDKLNG